VLCGSGEIVTTYGAYIVGTSPATSAVLAKSADEHGFDGIWTGEFYFTSATVKLAAWAGVTGRATLGSAIMYAVGRSPLVLAAEARDLDEVSGGRFILGLGTGTKRMISDWHGIGDSDAPAIRVEELVPLVRRLLRLHEEPVRHEGRFYRVDMSATAPAPPPVRAHIPIYTSGVRPRMMESAGRVADGLIGHPLFSAEYVADVARPAVQRGAEAVGREPSTIDMMSLVITSIHDDEEIARREAAQQIAFYSSVAGYKSLLDVSGFGAEGEAIRNAFRAGDVAAMFAAVSDPMVDALAVTGPAEKVAQDLRRYEGVLNHITLYPPSIGVDPRRVQQNTESLIGLRAAARPKT
jgi:probable F420-dependent oxidoreductase